MTKQNTNGEKPSETLRDGAIKATIWRNETEKDGEKRAFFTADISRTYQDDKGDYHDSLSFSGNDLLQVSHLALKAYDRMARLRQAEKALAEDDQS